MAITPDNLSAAQKKWIIDFYDAQPNGQLDASIKADLKDYKKYKQSLTTLDTQLTTDRNARNALIADLNAKIARLEKKEKIQTQGLILFEDNIVDRHFELNGQMPPADPTPV